jgi:hypothetical protein
MRKQRLTQELELLEGAQGDAAALAQAVADIRAASAHDTATDAGGWARCWPCSNRRRRRSSAQRRVQWVVWRTPPCVSGCPAPCTADAIAKKRSGRRGLIARKAAIAATKHAQDAAAMAATQQQLQQLQLSEPQLEAEAVQLMAERVEELAGMDVEADEARAAEILAGAPRRVIFAGQAGKGVWAAVAWRCGGC